MRKIERVELHATADHRLLAGDKPITEKDGQIFVAPIFVQVVDASVVGAFAPSPPPDGDCTILYRVWSGDDFRVGVSVARVMLDLAVQRGGPLWQQKWIVSASSRPTGEMEPHVHGWKSRSARTVPVVAFRPGGFLDEQIALEALAGIRSIVKPGDPIPRRPRVAIETTTATANGKSNGNGKPAWTEKRFVKSP